MFKTKNRNSRPAVGGGLKGALLGGALMLGAAVTSSGCLDRPVEPVTPNTSNVFVKAVRTSSIDKIDLVFMIDNSISMADKQEVLKQAVPNLLRRLIEPDCVDENDNPVAAPDGNCPTGTKRQFTPVNDIHIATITSALGAHGGSVCAMANANVINFNDMAHLLPSVRSGLADPNGTGFLAWTGGGQDVNTLIADFQSHVTGAGENGCGFEASLEAWYRFLVDPHPPAQIVNDNNNSVRTEDDAVLLAQRNAFLRSDSLVAIIMLSDENDCSIIDKGIGWLVSTPDRPFAPASGACAANPNDTCCYSCFGDPPPGCSADPICDNKNARLPAELDRGNVRCAQQKKRFGIDLLWPTQRYIEGLTRTDIEDSWLPPGSERVPNPLFISRPGKDGVEAGPRDPSLVFLAGIVGVPWQDIATEESLAAGAGLTYLTAAEITAGGVWDKILGDVNKGVMPTDMLMYESIDMRSGTDGTGQPLVGPDNIRGNAINGNEYDNSVPHAADSKPSNDDLQYACIFPLGDASIDCTVEANKNKCDCFSDQDSAKGKPLCEGKQQTYAKAYPGTRFLEVLKGIEDKAIVASICPKFPAGDTSVPEGDRGYNPAVGAIIKRLGEVLGGQCLPRELDVTEQGVSCLVIEASPTLSGVCDPATGRQDVPAEIQQAVRTELRATDACDGQTGIACSSVKMCQIRQFTEPAEKQECFTNSSSVNPGFCYIDPAKGPEGGGQNCDGPGPTCTNPFVTGVCPPEQQRILRFVGTEAAPVPAKGAITLTACLDS